ncbi:MAG: hypothetical protein AVDCRST_MAG73-4106 [uncultured Thermomicrobiales bacterium]|uniref:Uncharacterized protein n=1 Tax=uncultured Thermomicrobiales bacterium TaxID=1645740 RepID=A0A6J4V2H2_9BACT|nr:MAG: hypothetical protein AVDCRST_MAG73-4106 [uncultured Thermomicrobiales bacterium]
MIRFRCRESLRNPPRSLPSPNGPRSPTAPRFVGPPAAPDGATVNVGVPFGRMLRSTALLGRGTMPR